MNRFNLLRRVCAGVLIAMVGTFAVDAAPTDIDSRGDGLVTTAPGDPALAPLSEEQLVDLLQQTETTSWPPIQTVDPFWVINGVVNLGGGSITVPVHSPAALELARRGQRAVPALLKHLTDARPTQLVYVVRESVGNGNLTPGFGDEYDPRVRGTTNSSVQVNTGKRTPLNEGGIYTFKIGDLCYATLGQIVNRNLRAVRCRAEEAMMFSGPVSPNPGDWFMTINSPVERPALAAAARADWAGVDADQHMESLRADILKPVSKEPLDAGALVRLLYYHPGPGVDTAVKLLRRKLVEPEAGASAGIALPDAEGTVGFWWQQSIVKTLAPFHSDRLRTALLELFREAAAVAEADLKALPTGSWDPAKPSLGSYLALECARQFVHDGHDDELKTFFTARLAAIEASIRPGHSPGGSLELVNGIQAGLCRAFLSELEHPSLSPTGPSPKVSSAPVLHANVRLAPVVLTRRGSNLVVTVESTDPGLDRIFAGRVLIDTARDDLGATLWQDRVQSLAPVAVGWTSDDEYKGPPKASLVATLTRPAPRAKTLRSLRGRIEMIVPDLDPDAVVVVDDIVAKTGAPLDTKALRAADVAISIVIEKGGIELTISDPHERFLNVEFRNPKGQSLHYNHNGWSHRQNQGIRTDAYRLGEEIPPGTQMVVWLKTDKSFLVVPLKADDLPLPEIPTNP